MRMTIPKPKTYYIYLVKNADTNHEIITYSDSKHHDLTAALKERDELNACLGGYKKAIYFFVSSQKLKAKKAEETI